MSREKNAPVLEPPGSFDITVRWDSWSSFCDATSVSIQTQTSVSPSAGGRRASASSWSPPDTCRSSSYKDLSEDHSNMKPLPPVLLGLPMLFQSISDMAGSVKANKELCGDLADRVKSVERLVAIIRERGASRISVAVMSTLIDLHKNLEDAKDWMEKYSNNTALSKVIKSTRFEERFEKLDKKLTLNFTNLSVALQIKQADTVGMVWDSVRGEEETQKRPKIPSPIDDPPYPTDNSYPRFKIPASDPVGNHLMLPNSPGMPNIGFSNDVVDFSTSAPDVSRPASTAPGSPSWPRPSF